MTMTASPKSPLLSKSVLAVWVILVAATLLQSWLGSDHGIHNRQAAGTTILAVTVVKVWLIGSYFMELRDAPTTLKTVFTGWCVGLGAILLGMYLFG